MAILSSLLGLLGGGGGLLDPVTATITTVRYQRLSAAHDAERLEIDRQLANLRARRDVLVAGASGRWGWIDSTIRVSFAIPVSFYYGKIFIWDKALGWGVTDPLSEDLTWTARVIIGFYFLYEAARAVRR